MHTTLTWVIAAATIAAIVARPFRIPEWVWSATGAALIVALQLLTGRQAADAARDGLDVYAFLLGMLALAALADVHGVFDFFGDRLLEAAKTRTRRLFAWFFCVGVGVTALLSNDGTIVLLTPAALAMARRSSVSVMPLVYAVAFIANAASFILPISNPANLVVFKPLPQLLPWLATFAAPSAVAILLTYIAMRFVFARELRTSFERTGDRVALSPAAHFTAIVVGIALLLLVAAATLGWPVGYVAFALGCTSVLLVGARYASTLSSVAREAPWSVVPLVAGLFVIVRALDETGALNLARTLLRQASAMPPVLGRLYAGFAVTLANVVINNLPVGVIARYALRDHGIAPFVTHAVLIGIDLGPNVSISASLATLLWMMILRRDGVDVSARRFLPIGLAVALPALAAALII